jgi:mono/diheme cytochrome c family protein
MKRILITSGIATLGISAIMLFAGASASNENTSDGKSIFVSNKCNGCHSIQAQGVSKVAGETVNASTQPPDLSGVGLKHNAAWITKYLKKQETLDGEKHLKKFKGSDEDLATLTAWLESQKKKSK